MIGKNYVYLFVLLEILLFCGCFGQAVKPDLRDDVENITKMVEKHDKKISENSGVISEVHSKVVKNTTDIVKITTTEQHSNNPWPWMIATLAQPFLFLAFLYFSNSWKGKRGL